MLASESRRSSPMKMRSPARAMSTARVKTSVVMSRGNFAVVLVSGAVARL